MILVYYLNVEVLLKPPGARSVSNPDYIALLNQTVCIPQPMLQLIYPISTDHISLLNNLALAYRDVISYSVAHDEPLNLLRGGSNSIGGGDTAGAAGKGRVCGLNLLPDGLTDGGGESEADDDDEYIKALCLLRGGAVKDGCDVSDVNDMWDLLRDGLEYGDDGADDENPNSDDDEYSDDGGDDGSGDDGGGATIH
ncbi:hypothetical protein Tco_1542836 [Tanacetum coccineum]